MIFIFKLNCGSEIIGGVDIIEDVKEPLRNLLSYINRISFIRIDQPLLIETSMLGLSMADLLMLSEETGININCAQITTAYVPTEKTIEYYNLSYEYFKTIGSPRNIETINTSIQNLQELLGKQMNRAIN